MILLSRLFLNQRFTAVLMACAMGCIGFLPFGAQSATAPELTSYRWLAMSPDGSRVAALESRGAADGSVQFQVPLCAFCSLSGLTFAASNRRVALLATVRPRREAGTTERQRIWVRPAARSQVFCRDQCTGQR